MADRIGYREGLVQALEKSLRSAFNQPLLELSRRPKKDGPGFAVEIVAGGRDVQADDGRLQHVMEILTANAQSTTFYFSLVVDFEPWVVTRNHVVQHASLMVFHDLYAGELTSLFRAEWDEKAASDTSSEHAQPHWHFVQSPARIESIVRNALSLGIEFMPDKKSELFAGPDCGRFHFAMASMWDKSKSTSFKQIFDADDFPKWFDALTKYIAGQIAYLVHHAPGTRQFTPSNT